MSGETNGQTGKFRAYMANGGKKTVGKVAAAGGLSLGALLVTLHASPTLLPYVTAAEFKDTTSSVVEVKTEVRTMKESLTEFKQTYREDMSWIKHTLEKQSEKQGIVVTDPPRDTNKSPVVVFYKDSTGRGVVTKGDTVWIPESR